MRIKLLLVLCTICISSFSSTCATSERTLFTTYYVAPTGADTNPGTQGKPFATPQKAVDVAMPGDTIVLMAGTHHARIQFPRSGTPDRPITIQGEPGAILDAGEHVGGWEPAPEIGPMVYKNVHFVNNPGNFLWNGKYILTIHRDVMAKQGADILNKGPLGWDRVYNGPLIRSWDGVEVLWGSLNNVTYIRFRNGNNPNDEDLMSTPADWAGGSPIKIDGQSYIHVRGLTIRNGYYGISLAQQAHDVVIEQNQFIGQHDSVWISFGSHNIVVRENQITLNYIHTMNPNHPLHWFIWYVFKDISDFDRSAIRLFYAGNTIQVYNNNIYEHWEGFTEATDAANDPVYAQNIAFHHNTITTMTDECISIGGGAVNAQYYDNILRDCNVVLRVSNATTGPLYIYRNVMHTPSDGPSENIGVLLNNDIPGTIYFYHNSVSTGAAFATYTTATAPNVWFLNNIFSGAELGKPFNASRAKQFDYNWVGGSFAKRSWMGMHNGLFPGVRFWQNNDPTSSFVRAYRSVREKGLDLSKSNVLEGTTIPSLPGMNPGYFEGNRPDLGAYQYFIHISENFLPLLMGVDQHKGRQCQHVIS